MQKDVVYLYMIFKKQWEAAPRTSVRCSISSLSCLWSCCPQTVLIFVFCFLFSVFYAYLRLIVYSYYQQLQKCAVPEHRGSVETVLTMAENGEDFMLHYKSLSHGNCDGAATTVTFQTGNNWSMIQASVWTVLQFCKSQARRIQQYNSEDATEIMTKYSYILYIWIRTVTSHILIFYGKLKYVMILQLNW
jgi:hypothetical protein